MTDKNRIQRENAVAEALLGPGKTARNLMHLLLSGYENGKGVGVTVGADIYFSAPLPFDPGVSSCSVQRRIAAQNGDPAPALDQIGDVMERAG